MLSLIDWKIIYIDEYIIWIQNSFKFPNFKANCFSDKMGEHESMKWIIDHHFVQWGQLNLLLLGKSYHNYHLNDNNVIEMILPRLVNQLAVEPRAGIRNRTSDSETKIKYFCDRNSTITDPVCKSSLWISEHFNTCKADFTKSMSTNRCWWIYKKILTNWA